MAIRPATEKQKTHAEITEEMNCGPIPEHRHDREILRLYAYELDAAHKREVDALKRRRSELDAEVAAKDAVIKRLNDAISEEQRRKMATAENPSAVGDAAKLREAVAYLFTLIDMRKLVLDCDETEEISAVQVMLDECRAALAAPPRNCDMGTAEEQADRFRAYCEAHKDSDAECLYCPLLGKTGGHCELIWAQMPYVEQKGGAK